MAANRETEIDNAREDALASLQTLRDLPEELQVAHRRYNLKSNTSFTLTHHKGYLKKYTGGKCVKKA